MTSARLARRISGGGKAGPPLVILFRIEPDADAVGHPAAAPHALIGAAAGDGGDGQGGGAGAGRVARDAGQPRVHHVADTGDGNGCFGHIGGHNDFARPAAREHPALVGGREAGIERHDVRPGIPPTLQQFTGVADILLGGHEDQHVPAGALPDQIVHR